MLPKVYFNNRQEPYQVLRVEDDVLVLRDYTRLVSWDRDLRQETTQYTPVELKVTSRQVTACNDAATDMLQKINQ